MSVAISKKEQRIVAFVWVIGIIVVWELASFVLKNVLHDPMAATKLPYLHIIAITLVENWKTLLEAGAVTFSRAAIGFALGTTIGILLAIIMSLSKTMERIAFSVFNCFPDDTDFRSGTHHFYYCERYECIKNRDRRLYYFLPSFSQYAQWFKECGAG